MFGSLFVFLRPMFVVLFAIFFTTCVTGESCVRKNYTSYIMRGYQSSYLDVRNREQFPEIQGCEPVQIWSMVRHGTRNPHIRSLTRMDKYLATMRKELLISYYSGKGHLCFEDIAGFEGWTFDKKRLKQAKFLTPSGYQELVVAGRHIKERFPTIFGDSFDPKMYYFAYSNNQRNLLSCQAFGQGIFGDSFNASLDGNYDYLPEVGCRENIAVKTEAEPKSLIAVKSFFDSARIYERVVEHYAFMTGVERPLTEEQVDTLFEVCQYETANNRKPSPWCSLFDPYDLSLMVYSEQLIHYYAFSYGSSKAKDFGCLQIKGLMETFNSTVVNGYSSRKAKVYVSHDILMENIFTGLGCFKDSHPIAYEHSKMSTTVYNNSLNSPFAANLVAVLYRCTYDNIYKIQFYVNERPVGCCMDDSKEPCIWSSFEKHIRKFLDICTEDVCQDDVEKTLDVSDGAHNLKPSLFHFSVFLSLIYYVLASYL